MQEKATNELDELLEDMKPADLDKYYKENSKYLAQGEKAFYYFFKDVAEENGILLKDIYTAADLGEGWGSKVVRMEKHTKNRDTIIRLCLAGHFSWIQTSRALKLYGMSELYAKDPRDACIIVAINNRIFDPYRVDELLEEHGMEKLS